MGGGNQFSLLRQHELCRQLQYLLEEERIFLNAHLTLNELSKMLGTNSTYLSRIINQHYQCNFRTLLKQHRIAYCKQLLQGEEEYCMDQLSKDCGFLSRSNFYAAFRELTGMTPAEYRFLYKLGKINQ